MRNLTLSAGIFLFAQFSSLTSQNHDHLWFYGANSGQNPPPASSVFGKAIIDFYQQPAIAYKSQDILANFNVTASVCSDSTGNLLFYSNGIAIRAKNHSKMQNGDTLNPGQFWAGSVSNGYTNVISSFSLPFPGHPNEYYYFHCGWLIDQDSFYIRNNPFYFDNDKLN